MRKFLRAALANGSSFEMISVLRGYCRKQKRVSQSGNRGRSRKLTAWSETMSMPETFSPGEVAPVVSAHRNQCPHAE